jgi:hypothetical protein
MMSRVDGVELCRRLKGDTATALIPVVMLSAALPPVPAEPPWDVQHGFFYPAKCKKDRIFDAPQAQGLLPRIGLRITVSLEWKTDPIQPAL